MRVKSGTPEGSIISPLFFALFVNEFPLMIKNSCLMFADDIKIFSEIVCHDDTSRLQNDLTVLSEWSKTWRLKLNASKCQTFTITLRRDPIVSIYCIDNTSLNKVDKIRDLGVTFDSTLTFCKHIDIVVSKANRIMGIIMRSMQTGYKRGNFNWKPILTAYYGNVRSILEYCCVIWGGAAKSNLDRLDKIQHRFLHWLYCYVWRRGLPFITDYHDLLQCFGVTRLENRRQQYDIMFVTKLYNGYSDCSLLLAQFPLYVAPRSTRRTERTRGIMNVPFARVEAVKRSLFVRAPMHLNQMMFKRNDIDLFHDPLGQSRKKIISYIKEL